MGDNRGQSGRSQPITRDEIESALRDLQGDINREAQPLLVKIGYAAAGVTAALTGVAYILGRRAGRKRSAIVEIRRR